ncbi:MAG: RidA family protein [Acidimicrobiales bacterium]
MSAARRTAIHVEGLSHGANPIPAASRVDNIVYSGGVAGQARDGSGVPDSIEDQTINMFSNMEAIVEAAGGSVADIVRVTVFARDRDEVGEALNTSWLQMFPDEHDRPARHLTIADIHPALRIQCEFVAVLAA